MVFTKAAADKLKPGTILTFKTPTSFTDSQETAEQFASGTMRKITRGRNRVPDQHALVLRALIPKGTRIARIGHMALGVGQEHVVASKSKFHVTAVIPGKKQTILEGHFA